MHCKIDLRNSFIGTLLAEIVSSFIENFTIIVTVELEFSIVGIAYWFMKNVA